MLNFINNPYHNPDIDGVVEVDLSQFMQDWETSAQAKIAKQVGDHPAGATEKAQAKREHYEEKMENKEPIEMARTGLDEDGGIEIADGRHRLTAMFQAGVENVALCVPKLQAEQFVQKWGDPAIDHD